MRDTFGNPTVLSRVVESSLARLRMALSASVACAGSGVVAQRRVGVHRVPRLPPLRGGVCPDAGAALNIVDAGLRALAHKHHPDAGGNTKTMQRLNPTAD